MVYRKILFPFLCLLEAERAHQMVLMALERAQGRLPGRIILRFITGKIPARPVHCFGLTFPNVLGMAAGFDKDGRVPAGLGQLGFGHVEIGTLTPWPQPGNPRPRLFRLPADGAIINRLGFPNQGTVAAVQKLRRFQEQPGPKPIIGLSLGKQKETPLEESGRDYVTVMQAVYPFADYLAVNISSPNTPGLRQLQGGHHLDSLLGLLMAEKKRVAAEHKLPNRPLLLKIAPDLSWTELDDVISAAIHHKIDGLIATNTTTGRDNLRHPRQKESGGLSGRPLFQRSLEIVSIISRQSPLPIIGVGGLRSADDVKAMLDAGASLVQLYTGLIYEGPSLPGRILRQL